MADGEGAVSSPRIVVGISAFNEALYLDETMPALLAQTMPDFRAVILDNGSTDATWEILARYADSRITLLRAPENLKPGKVANLLYGLAADLWAECRWFLGHGADDVMHVEYLEALLDAAAANPEANLIFSPWRWLGHPEKAVKYFPRFDPETCHAEHQVPAWHAVRRDLREAAGAYDETMIAADWDWVVRARHLLHPVQLAAPYLSLRVRTERRTQSDEVHWPTLHRHLCELAGKPVPAWATERTPVLGGW